MITPEKLQDLCEVYLVEQGINTDNCLFLLNFTDGAELKLLFQESLDFCLDHFTQLTDSDDFVHLDKCLLIQILQSDRLNVPDELFVLAAISKWSAANEVDQQVVSTVRYSLIDKEELEKFDNKQLIGLARNTNQSSGRAKENRRTPDRRERLVALFGPDLCRYDPITNAWARMAKIPYAKSDIKNCAHSLLGKLHYSDAPFNSPLATLGDSLYMFCERKILRLDLEHHTWHEDVAPINKLRGGVRAVELNGSLYALGGGCCYLGGVSSVERYDARNNTWHICAPMRQTRWYPAAAVLDGRIYVADGWRSESEGYIECYRPQENTWSDISNPLFLGWKGQVCSMVSFEGCLYLLDREGQVFEYQAESDVWEKFTEGRLPYEHLPPGSCLHVLNGKLYARVENYFHLLDRVIGDTEFRWWWRKMQQPTSPREIDFRSQNSYGLHQCAIYYGLDCVDPSRTFNQNLSRAKENPRTSDRRERLVALFDRNLCRYDPITNAWARISKIPLNGLENDFVGSLALATLDDSLYLFCENKILRLDLKHHTWHDDVAPVNEPRLSLAVVVLNGNLYALGGVSLVCRSDVRTVERYDARNNRWHLCAPMRQLRWLPATAVLDGRIYVADRRIPKDGTKGYIECYRPQENTWTDISNPLSLGWKGQASSMVSFEGCLYLLDEESQVFKYQAESDVWEEVPKSPTLDECLPRRSYLHVLNGKLYARDENYFHVLERVIGDTEFGWRWRKIQEPTSQIEIDFEIYYGRAIYYGLDCVDPSRTFNQSSSKAKENPRTSDRRERLVAIFGPDLCRYDPITNAWARISKIPLNETEIRRSELALATLGDSVYLLSGTKILRFDLKHHTWHEDVAPMNELGGDVSAVELNGCLYVLGDSWHDSTVVERYDALNNTWHLCAPMRQPRCYPATAVLDGRIYVCGGQHSESDGWLECYRPQENSWSDIISPLFLGWDGWEGRVRNMVSFEGCLYLLDREGQVFEYQAESDVWEKFTEGRLPYEFLPPGSCLHVLNGKLYARDENYFHVLDRVIGDTEFHWWWRKMKTPTSPREIDFSCQDRLGAHQWAIYYGLDCADPPKTD